MVSMTKEQIKRSFAKARSAQEKGAFADAKKIYERLKKAAPGLAEIPYNLALIAVSERRFAEATDHFEQSLKQRPNEIAIWLAYLELGTFHPDPSALRKLLARAGDVVKDHPARSYFEGVIAARTGAPEAADLLRAALSKGYETPALHVELGAVLDAQGESADALEAYAAALALEPGHVLALSRKTNSLRDLGRSKEALASARRTIEAEPDRGEHYYAYASIQKIEDGDPYIAQMERRFKRQGKANPGRAALGFALAKAMEDTGAKEKVFAYLRAANDSVARQFPYGADADEAFSAKLQTLFETLEVPGSALDDELIFVTGIPRSGTTLVEQILASHSRVTGGGEMALLFGQFEKAFVAGQLSKSLSEAARSYIDLVRARHPDADIVTDKSISTYGIIGFVRHVLPRARIVVVRRDPRDNALSLYKNQFAAGRHRYASKLVDIARFIRLFERQIDYWRSVVPDAFYEMSYEELIADPDQKSRDLVAAAGLEWEEGCLDFYNSARKVTTLSSTQVRQPIYSSSVGAWEQFADELAPFIDEYQSLGGELDQE